MSAINCWKEIYGLEPHNFFIKQEDLVVWHWYPLLKGVFWTLVWNTYLLSSILENLMFLHIAMISSTEQPRIKIFPDIWMKSHSRCEVIVSSSLFGEDHRFFVVSQ